MKTASALLPCFALALGVQAQNLVPNGSFEEYSECPDLWNQMDRATSWSAYRGTPDYFNACDITGVASVPLNFAGNRSAVDGGAYAAVIALEIGGPPNFREHFGADLIMPLIPHAPVFLSFKVIMATGGIQDDCRWSVDGVGMRFTMAPYSPNNNLPLPNDAALHLTTAPLDMTDWTTVSGTYVPDSAYRHIVLGGFFNDDLVTPVQFNPNGNIDRAFAFIDDVCVAYDPAVCGLTQTVGEHRSRNNVRVSSPFDTELHLWLAEAVNEALTVELLDATGRVVWNTRLWPGSLSFRLPTPAFPDGVYLLRLSGRGGTYPPLRVVRQAG